MDSNEIRNIKLQLASIGVSDNSNKDIYLSAMQEARNGRGAVMRKAKNMLLDLREKKMNADSQQAPETQNPVVNMSTIFEKCKDCKRNIFIFSGIVATIIIVRALIKKENRYE
jgi:hypothetical protein